MRYTKIPFSCIRIGFYEKGYNQPLSSVIPGVAYNSLLMMPHEKYGTELLILQGLLFQNFIIRLAYSQALLFRN